MGKKILQVVANLRVSNGVTSVIMNSYNQLIEAGFHVDFLVQLQRESPYIDYVLSKGGNIYELPHNGSIIDKKAAKKYIEKVIQEENYDIIHTHLNGKYAVMVTYIAKKKNVPYRIYHTHALRDTHNAHALLYTLIYDSLCVLYSNRFVGCSHKAAKQMFGFRKYEIIRNTIDTNKLKYSKADADLLKERLGIEDKYIIGTVCRQTFLKNPYYLIDVIENICKKIPNTVLIWAGTGELEEDIKTYVKEKQLCNHVLFIGNQTDMKSVYSCMDAFFLPSKGEGFGIVYIEAQSCGVPTFGSDRVPRETNLTDLMHYIPLVSSVEKCADIIIKHSYKQLIDRSSYGEQIIAAGYDSNHNTDLLDYYRQKC